MSTTDELLAELKESYINSFSNQTDEIEGYLLQLEKGQSFQENFEALYRRVHSIKGSAGTYGFGIISSICHQMEDYVSDHLKPNCKTVVIDTLFAYLDLLTETRDGLLEENIDLPEIERKLESISRQSQSRQAKVLCIGVNNTIYQKIIKDITEQLNVQCSFVESGIVALERLVHEQFDAMISSKENEDLRGTALIAALKLNKRKNAHIKSILITTDPKIDGPDQLHPDYVILKNSQFPATMEETLRNVTQA